MRWIIFLVVVPLVCFCSDSVAVITGRIVLDRDTVLKYFPISGYVELETDTPESLEGGIVQYVSFQGNGMSLEIIRPDQTVFLVDNNAIFKGTTVGSPSVQEAFLWKPEQRVQFPIFVLKSRSEFAINISGDYEITIKFNKFPEPVFLKCEFSALESQQNNIEDYLQPLSGFEYLNAFFYGVGNISLPEGHPYLDAYAICRAYTSGGDATRAFYYSNYQKILKNKIFFYEIFNYNISEGVFWSNLAKVNNSLWKVLEEKKSAMLKGDRSFIPNKVGQNGVLFVIGF